MTWSANFRSRTRKFRGTANPPFLLTLLVTGNPTLWCWVPRRTWLSLASYQVHNQIKFYYSHSRSSGINRMDSVRFQSGLRHRRWIARRAKDLYRGASLLRAVKSSVCWMRSATRSTSTGTHHVSPLHGGGISSVGEKSAGDPPYRFPLTCCGCPSIRAKVLSRTNYPWRCVSIVLFATELTRRRHCEAPVLESPFSGRFGSCFLLCRSTNHRFGLRLRP